LLCTEHGQFPPKPADIMRQISGDSGSRSQVAWQRVTDAVKRHGPYASVVFDDPTIHAAVEAVGGWTELGRINEQEWVFVGNRFMQFYKGNCQRRTPYPTHLKGIAELQNPGKKPDIVPIGEVKKCREVYRLAKQAQALQDNSPITSGQQAMLAAMANLGANV
jgi:hypothetical protein